MDHLIRRGLYLYIVDEKMMLKYDVDYGEATDEVKRAFEEGKPFDRHTGQFIKRTP